MLQMSWCNLTVLFALNHLRNAYQFHQELQRTYGHVNLIYLNNFGCWETSDAWCSGRSYQESVVRDNNSAEVGRDWRLRSFIYTHAWSWGACGWRGHVSECHQSGQSIYRSRVSPSLRFGAKSPCLMMVRAHGPRRWCRFWNTCSFMQHPRCWKNETTVPNPDKDIFATCSVMVQYFHLKQIWYWF